MANLGLSETNRVPSKLMINESMSIIMFAMICYDTKPFWGCVPHFRTHPNGICLVISYPHVHQLNAQFPHLNHYQDMFLSLNHSELLIIEALWRRSQVTGR